MDIALAVESEWGSKRDVLHDFGKLLVVKAPLKLMVFDKRKDVIKDIQERYMQKFSQHVEDEHYLLLELDTPRKEARPFPLSRSVEWQGERRYLPETSVRHLESLRKKNAREGHWHFAEP